MLGVPCTGSIAPYRSTVDEPNKGLIKYACTKWFYTGTGTVGTYRTVAEQRPRGRTRGLRTAPPAFSCSRLLPSSCPPGRRPPAAVFSAFADGRHTYVQYVGVLDKITVGKYGTCFACCHTVPYRYIPVL